MPAWIEPNNPVTSVRARAERAVRVGRRDKEAKSFIDGIPKGAWLLAGFLAPDLLRKGKGRKT